MSLYGGFPRPVTTPSARSTAELGDELRGIHGGGPGWVGGVVPCGGSTRGNQQDTLGSDGAFEGDDLDAAGQGRRSSRSGVGDNWTARSSDCRMMTTQTVKEDP